MLLFYYIIEPALQTFSLLGQLVFCTYTLFGTLKIHYGSGRVVMALDSGSDVRGFQPPSPTIFFFLCQIKKINNYNIHDILSILIFHK